MIYALFFATMFSLSFAYGVCLMAILTPRCEASPRVIMAPLAGFIQASPYSLASPQPFAMVANPVHPCNFEAMASSLSPVPMTANHCHMRHASRIGQTRVRGAMGRMIGALSVQCPSSFRVHRFYASGVQA